MIRRIFSHSEEHATSSWVIIHMGGATYSSDALHYI